MLLSASRDKTLIIWHLSRDDQAYGYPKRRLIGHNHIVSDCVREIGAPGGGRTARDGSNVGEEDTVLTRILLD